MPFPKIDNDLVDTGVADGKIPVIGAGNKLATSIVNTGLVDGKIPVVGIGDKLDMSLIDTGLTVGKIVQLDGTGKLPAIDGSLLNNIPAPSGGAGAWDLLDTQIASNSAQVDFTTGITSAYKEYIIRGMEVVHSTTSHLGMRVRVAGAFKNSNEYTYAGDGTSNQQGNVSFNDASGFEFMIIPGVLTPATVDGSSSFDVSITNPADTTSTKAIRSNAGGSVEQDNGGFSCQSGGRWFGASQTPPFDYSAIDGFRILPSSGVLVRGIFKLYGIS